MNPAMKAALQAVVRRFLTLSATALLTYYLGILPDLVTEALLSSPYTVAAIPAVLLVIEFIQKLVREKRAGGDNNKTQQKQ